MSPVERGASIDELLDRAVAAINRGDRAAATALAGQVLAVDRGNVDAEDLLAAPGSGGELRRLTILFADLVDSTVLSIRVEPETYRMLVGRYRDLVLGIVNRFEGHVGSTQGDGLLAVFGHPKAHEDDVRRAVFAGLEIIREVATLSEQAKRRFGIEINVRVGVHRGLVYLDTAQDDVYGLAANLAARVSGLAPPGAVVVSDAVEPLISNNFELAARPPAPVKGVAEPITHYRVVGERASEARVGRGPLVGRDRELRRLKKSWARAQVGTLSTPGVVFRGEPGIGKSRLAAAAAELVDGSGGVILELNGSPFHTDAGLHPVRTLIERRCGIGRLTDPAERLRLLEAAIRSCLAGTDGVTHWMSASASVRTPCAIPTPCSCAPTTSTSRRSRCGSATRRPKQRTSTSTPTPPSRNEQSHEPPHSEPSRADTTHPTNSWRSSKRCDYVEHLICQTLRCKGNRSRQVSI